MPPRNSARKKTKTSVPIPEDTRISRTIPATSNIIRRLSPYHRKLSIYVASARDAKINIQRREFAWYGPWNYVLNHHFLDSSEFYIYPQWPVWKLLPNSILSDISSTVKSQKALLPTSASDDDSMSSHSESSEDDVDEDSRDPLDLLPPTIQKVAIPNEYSSSVEEDIDDESRDPLDLLTPTIEKVTGPKQFNDPPTKGSAKIISSILKVSKTPPTNVPSSQSKGSGKSMLIEPAKTAGKSWDNKPMVSIGYLPASATTEHTASKAKASHLSIPGKRGKGVIHNTASSSKGGKESTTIAENRQTIEPYVDMEEMSREQTAGRPTKSEQIVTELLSEREDEDGSKFQKGSSLNVGVRPVGSQLLVAKPTHKAKNLKKGSRGHTRQLVKFADQNETTTSDSDELRNDRSDPKDAQSKDTAKATQRYTGSQKVTVAPDTEDEDSSTDNEDSADDSDSSDSAKSQWKDSSRLPDFAVLRLTPVGSVPFEDLKRKFPLLEDAETALLMEVKRLVVGNSSHVMKQLSRAQEDLRVQVAYVFSRSAQTSVIAVAVAGDRYQWAVLKKNPRMPSCTPSEDEDPTWTPLGNEIKPVILKGEWSSYKRIVSVQADADWEAIKQSL